MTNDIAYTPRHRSAAINVRNRPIVAGLLFATSLGLAIYFAQGTLSWFGFFVLPILTVKFALSLIPPREWPEANPDLRVGAIVTVYNEDPGALRSCLESLVKQTHRLTRLVIVDDFSTTMDAMRVAIEYCSRYPDLVSLSVHIENRGKRQAIRTGVGVLPDIDVFLCVDSDTVLELDAVSHGIRPFGDDQVTAVTGMVLAQNYRRNLLTRMIDLRYVNAFLGERAAYSNLNSVLCVCGSLAFYRADVVRRHIEAFVGQMFLGKIATVGDDRHMTNLCLTEGSVVLSQHAISSTLVPERVHHYIRQQTRWGRSFFRESLWAIRTFRPNMRPWWLSLVEVGQWVGFTSMLLYVVIVRPILHHEILLGEYILLTSAMSMVRSVRYFDVTRAAQSTVSRVGTLLTAPLYGLLSLFVLLPLRVWSLLTLRRTTWGTRKKVEVTAS